MCARSRAAAAATSAGDEAAWERASVSTVSATVWATGASVEGSKRRMRHQSAAPSVAVSVGANVSSADPIAGNARLGETAPHPPRASPIPPSSKTPLALAAAIARERASPRRRPRSLGAKWSPLHSLGTAACASASRAILATAGLITALAARPYRTAEAERGKRCARQPRRSQRAWDHSPAAEAAQSTCSISPAVSTRDGEARRRAGVPAVEAGRPSPVEAGRPSPRRQRSAACASPLPASSTAVAHLTVGSCTIPATASSACRRHSSPLSHSRAAALVRRVSARSSPSVKPSAVAHRKALRAVAP